MNLLFTFLINAWLIISPVFLNQSVINHKFTDMTIEYHPIGIFHTELGPQTGAPRQGILDMENKGTIEIEEQYTEALSDIDKYDYIIVIYHLHLSRDWHSYVRPPGSERSFGLFATRSPNRPNPIGIAVLRLEKVRGNTLHVRGVDAYDGTPVLDIKPWLHSIDCHPDAELNEIESELGL